ncbi:uncharacterized protein MELLADRAFT_92227 [Melampsora larici-populina 98AG31]|uniref:Uncharacterized protein n=1 Tax=Melampsora larici-populina (strain 98AG31 / pathotype 3-4-7) TaxID=747676 RepID=F4R8W3_MELLP|nr:uncharacterized protein MELLADRAFT_92227 [Melampsora larici-populina 98AG31]EGG10880.1 hypothetical protein MELLADRAFT_92227 [Melampsora larici-populina 98AG31]
MEHLELDNDDVEEHGVSVNINTSRERLLKLLSKKVKKRRTRSTSKNLHQQSEMQNDCDDTSLVVHKDKEPSTNFSVYKDSELVSMLRTVGLDTRGFSREVLIQNCKSYHELIIPPSPPDLDDDQAMSCPISSVIDSTILPAFTFEVPMYSNRFADQTSSTSNLPSLEHGRFSYPRPRPTTNLVPSKKNKGKAKEKSPPVSESEYQPSDTETIETNKGPQRIYMDSGVKVGGEGGRASGSAMKGTEQSCSQDPNKEAKNCNAEDQNSRPLEDKDRKLLHELKQQVDSLTHEVVTLNQIIKQHLNNKLEGDSKKKTKGGRTSAHIRFHIDTLLGRRSNDEVLPAPASATDKEKWGYDIDMDKLVYDPNALPLATDSADPCFPYEDGPGHEDSSPQQLAIMWQLMTMAGVSSFRPDFSLSATSCENKWLWDLALKIFVVLVECGEYQGVSLDAENQQFIKKCLNTHVQSLAKTYRQQVSWSPERKQLAAAEIRRGSRMRHLVERRSKFLLKEEIWPLLAIVKQTTSDDETDVEAAAENISNRNGLPCRVRKVLWRSSLLSDIWELVDKCIEKIDKSKPGQSSPRGRQRRPRTRINNGPRSRVEAASGLPNDCLDRSWLENLSPATKAGLEISTKPILAGLKERLQNLEA